LAADDGEFDQGISVQAVIPAEAGIQFFSKSAERAGLGQELDSSLRWNDEQDYSKVIDGPSRADLLQTMASPTKESPFKPSSQGGWDPFFSKSAERAGLGQELDSSLCWNDER
jgi:hypothetical protein